MSLIHQALNRPEPPERENNSQFNPMGRPNSQSRALWWWITAMASLATLSLLGYQGWQSLNNTPAVQESTPQTPSANQAVARLSPPKEVAKPVDSPSGPSVEQTPIIQSKPEESLPAAPVPANPKPATPKPAPIEAPQPETQQKVEVDVETKAAPELIQPEPEVKPEAVANAPTEETPAKETGANSTPTITKATVKPVMETANTDTAESNPVRPARNPDQDLEARVQNALDQGELERAESLLNGWIARAPDAEMPRLWLAKIYLSSGLPEAADPLLNGLGSVEALGLRGLLLEKTGRYQVASQVFEHLTRREPETPGWWLHWAINQENSGQLAKARILYQTFLKEFSAYDASLTAFARERYQALEGW